MIPPEEEESRNDPPTTERHVHSLNHGTGGGSVSQSVINYPSQLVHPDHPPAPHRPQNSINPQEEYLRSLIIPSSHQQQKVQRYRPYIVDKNKFNSTQPPTTQPEPEFVYDLFICLWINRHIGSGSHTTAPECKHPPPQLLLMWIHPSILQQTLLGTHHTQAAMPK